MSHLVTESAGGEVTVATSGGDHLPDSPTPASQATPEVLRLLDQTRVALAEARDLLADSEQRAAEEHELALRLQRAIMPSGVTLLAASGVDISVRCRPALTTAL